MNNGFSSVYLTAIVYSSRSGERRGCGKSYWWNNQALWETWYISKYGKYPKNSNTKASDKMTYANSVDPDQAAPEGAV